MVSDLFTTLKVYLTKVAEGEKSATEIVAGLNSWMRESGESIKAKVESEVEASVTNMGFIKREEFDALATELALLKSTQKISKVSGGPSKKGAAKKTALKKSVNNRSDKIAKKSVKKRVKRSVKK